MEIIACVLWIWGNAFAGLLALAGHILMLPGRAMVFVAEWVLDWLGEE